MMSRSGCEATSNAPPKGSRYIPAAIRKAVWERDGGQCTFVGSNGRRCTSKHRLQLHHRAPFGKNGATTVENLTLRCQTHNLYAAEQDYGREHMARWKGSRARECSPAGSTRASVVREGFPTCGHRSRT